MKRLCLLAAALAAFPGCATLEEGGAREVEVEAEGWTPLDRADLVATERRAMADAQKKAVEKAIGVTLRAQTQVSDAISVRESIEANLGGTIRRYKVLSAGATGNVYKVRILADVLYRPLAKSHVLKSRRFAVHLANGKAASALRDVLIENDFPVVDRDQDADVVVTGIVETFGRADLRLGGFYSYRAKLTLTVADVREGTVVDETQEGSALDTDERAACDEALETAAKTAALALAQRFETSAAQAASR